MRVPWRAPAIRNVRHSAIITKTISTLGVAAVLFSLSAPAYADSFDDQIRAAQAAANAASDQANAYKAQANDYQSRVNQLRSQGAVLYSQITVNQAKSNKLNAQIADAKTQMANNKAILAQNIKSMYLDSSVTPLEMLASSSDISEFFNQQQYQDKVKDKIQTAMEAIIQLKADLEKQQTELTQVLADQQNQQQALAAQQNEINGLLAAAQQGATTADAQVQSKNAEVGRLKAQQAAALAALFGNSGLSGGSTCGGGYPGRWCNAGQDTIVDNWGMFNRECVSYAAFKVAASGRHMPYWGGNDIYGPRTDTGGNARQWVNNARYAGIPYDHNPRAGDIAISTAGPYGHAMYVEAVIGSQVHVSQYNYGNNGEYSTMTISSAGLYFIHF